MRTQGLVFGLGVLLAGLPAAAVAQSKEIPGEKVSVTATVEAIEASTRSVTLKGPKGNYTTIVVPKTVTRFDEIKVGDTLRATYYDNVVVRLRQPNEKPSPADKTSEALTKTPGAKPGAVAATQRTIVATISAIDPSVPSISFTGPNKWAYTSKVQDKAALAKVKVGDQVDITWTEALMISFEKVAK
jgi:hypothetical protein